MGLPPARAVTPNGGCTGRCSPEAGSWCTGGTWEHSRVGDPAIPCRTGAARGLRAAWGGGLPAAKGPPWHPVQPHCSPERVGRAQVRSARLLVGAGAPGPWARRGLAHLDITRLSKRYEEARN